MASGNELPWPDRPGREDQDLAGGLAGESRGRRPKRPAREIGAHSQTDKQTITPGTALITVPDGLIHLIRRPVLTQPTSGLLPGALQPRPSRCDVAPIDDAVPTSPTV